MEFQLPGGVGDVEDPASGGQTSTSLQGVPAVRVGRAGGAVAEGDPVGQVGSGDCGGERNGSASSSRAVPGAGAEIAWGDPASDSGKSKTPRSGNRLPRAAPGHPYVAPLHTDVWEHHAGAWELTHHFSKGLEVDLDALHSKVDGKAKPLVAKNGALPSRVHLPLASLRGFQQLRAALERPGAVALDADEAAEEVSPHAGMRGAHRALLEQMSDALGPEACREAREMLALRGALGASAHKGHPATLQAEVNDDVERQSTSSEDILFSSETGDELADISVCPLQCTRDSSCPLVAFTRLRRPSVDTMKSVRYAALVVCSSNMQGAPQLAAEVGRALAVTFVDEGFTGAVSTVKADQPDGVLAAFDAYLSSLTLVPSVYVPTQEDGVDEKVGECLLSDTLVDKIEDIVCSTRGLHRHGTGFAAPAAAQVAAVGPAHQPAPGAAGGAGIGGGAGGACAGNAADPAGAVVPRHACGARPHPPERRRRFFIEVSERASSTVAWRTTHKLRQGLEVDLYSAQGGPHLPRVSVVALADARRLMTQNSILLNVDSTPGSAFVAEAVLSRLRAGGLPDRAQEDARSALLDGATVVAAVADAQGGNSAEGLGRMSVFDVDVKDLSQAAHVSLVRPAHGDEACHVLVSATSACSDIVGAFVRFRDPLVFVTPGTGTRVRFLIFLVGPEGSPLSTMGDSLAALATDEDLMGDLAAANSPAAFIDAVDERLSSFVVMPHTRLTASFMSPSKQKSKCAAQTSPSAAEKARSPRMEPVMSVGSEGSGDVDLRACPSHATSVKAEHAKETGQSSEHHDHGEQRRRSAFMRFLLDAIQKYSAPLVIGVLGALVWSNVDIDSYHKVVDSPIFDGAKILGHPLTLHFVINDIFMCFFFGLAIKEVTEALLPGGSLFPIKRAVNPLLATLGGVIGPAAMYVLTVAILWATNTFDGTMCSTSAGGSGGSGASGSSASEPCSFATLARGWGVPTATDISLAWMFALQIFGPGHPAINFLLLLAIVDDAIGMGIIAIQYSDPEHPVEPEWLALVVLAAFLAFCLRKMRTKCWQVYVFVAMPFSWLGLLKAHVHPALALVPVVPFMDAQHAIRADANRPDLGRQERVDDPSILGRTVSNAVRLGLRMGTRSLHMTHIDTLLNAVEAEGAPLHRFEHHLKLPVDIGMFFFGLANAGVKLNNFGGVTISVIVSLVVGKTLGIAAFGVFGVALGFDLPAGVTYGDLLAMSALGGVGLTVALFVANEAFVDPGLRGQAKFGAVLSVGAASVAWALRRAFRSPARRTSWHDQQDVMEDAFGIAPVAQPAENEDEEQAAFTDDLAVDQILQILWLQRRYQARGITLPLTSFTPIQAQARESVRSGSKGSTLASLSGGGDLELGRSSLRNTSKLSVRSAGSVEASTVP